MKALFVVTIDTESDKAPDWSVSRAASFAGVLKAIPEQFMPLFSKYGVRPSFLLSPEVIEDARCAAVLQHLGSDVELGTHLHGEFAEPLRELFPHNMAGKRTISMQSSYGPSLEAEKLHWVTLLFRARFGYAPRSFRAGRFGLGHNTLEVLAGLGYAVDTSVTPGLLWCDEGGEADFRQWDHRAQKICVSQKGAAPIIEIPVTILPRSIFSRMFQHKKYKMVGGCLRKVLGRLGGFDWLRPSFNTAERMIKICQKVEGARSGGNGIVILNMMLHNVEIVPGASPYARTQEQADLILDRMDKVFRFASSSGYSFVTLAQAAEAVSQQ